MSKSAKSQSTVIEGYDAVAEVRKVRDRLAEEMEGMSSEEQIAFLQAKAEKFRRENLKQGEAQPH